MDGPNPVFFISELAEHTKNLRGDPRASLLAAEGGEGDPLARGRVTLIGHARRLDEGSERDAAKQSYLQAHPNAAYYIDYSDFGFWRLDVDAVRYIGGYGRMSWISIDEWRESEADPIAPHARRIIDHMNTDHADAMVRFCRVLTKATDTSSATMTSVDRYGFEMSAQTGRGPRPIRLAFPTQIKTPDDARREMVNLVKRCA
jgi:putative heme iron utilization protein